MNWPYPIIRCLSIAAVALALPAAAGCGSSGDSTAGAADTRAAVATYRGYLLENAEKLTTWTTQLRNKFKLRIFGGAQSRFASSQVPLGHLRPGLAFLPHRAEQLVDPDGGAFPRIERLLWKKGQAGRQGVEEASRALESILLLHEELKTVDLPPARILAGADAMLEEIATVDLQIEATPYARIDLIPTSANLEGAEAAYAALKPQAKAEDPELARDIDKEFKAAFTALEEFGPPAHNLDQPRPSSPGTAFITTEHEQVKPGDLQPTARHVAELQALFDRLSSTVGP